MEPKRGGEAENPATWDDVERDIKQDAVNERVPELLDFLLRLPFLVP